MVSTLHEGKFVFPKPCPDGRILKDVLETDVDESLFLSQEKIQSFVEHEHRHKEKGNGFGFNVKNIEREREASAITSRYGRNTGTWVGYPKARANRKLANSNY